MGRLESQRAPRLLSAEHAHNAVRTPHITPVVSIPDQARPPASPPPRRATARDPSTGPSSLRWTVSGRLEPTINTSELRRHLVDMRADLVERLSMQIDGDVLALLGSVGAAIAALDAMREAE